MPTPMVRKTGFLACWSNTQTKLIRAPRLVSNYLWAVGTPQALTRTAHFQSTYAALHVEHTTAIEDAALHDCNRRCGITRGACGWETSASSIAVVH